MQAQHARIEFFFEGVHRLAFLVEHLALVIRCEARDIIQAGFELSRRHRLSEG